MTGFKDYFSSVSTSYRDYRPRYPVALFEHLAEIAPGRSLAWDVATGSGQAAGQLAQFFQRVIATDASEEQVRNAERADKIEYCVEPAEASGHENDSVDLVTVAQALHWFDLPAFEREARRVARPGAILAAWSYGILQSTPAIDAVIESLYNGILGEYWTPERRIVEQGYRDVAFGFEPLDCPAFAMRAHWTAGHMLGYLSTWSAARRYEEQHGDDPVSQVRDALLDAWGNPDDPIEIAWPLAIKIWRVGDRTGGDVGQR